MKKLFLLVLGFIISINVFSQRIGVRVGPQFMNYATSENYDTKVKIGYGLGAFFESKLVPMFFLRTELAYFQDGYKYEYNILNLKTYGEVHIENLGLIMDLKFKPVLIPVYVVAGPYMSYALSGYSEGYSETPVGKISFSGVVDFDNSDYKRFDAGLTGGLGFVFKLPIVHFFIEGRYMLGLANLSKNDDYYIKNRNFGLHAGVSIGF